MDNQQLNALVAEKVMGWTRRTAYQVNGGQYPWRNQNGAGTLTVPDFTTDVAADYSVLVHVRDNWHGVSRMWFNVKLQGILQQRRTDDPLLGREDTEDVPLWEIGQYQPGDYSHAALQALVVEIVGRLEPVKEGE